MSQIVENLFETVYILPLLVSTNIESRVYYGIELETMETRDE